MAQKNLLHGFKCHSQGKPFGPVIGVTVGKNTVFLVTTSYAEKGGTVLDWVEPQDCDDTLCVKTTKGMQRTK